MDKNSDWKAVISDWEESGLSQSEYCKRSGIIESKFSYWKRKLLSSPIKQSNFIAVGKDSSRIELSVGKVNLKLPSSMKPDRLAALVKCLS